LKRNAVDLREARDGLREKDWTSGGEKSGRPRLTGAEMEACSEIPPRRRRKREENLWIQRNANAKPCRRDVDFS
jgi:hypothetical protein